MTDPREKPIFALCVLMKASISMTTHLLLTSGMAAQCAVPCLKRKEPPKAKERINSPLRMTTPLFYLQS